MTVSSDGRFKFQNARVALLPAEPVEYWIGAQRRALNNKQCHRRVRTSAAGAKNFPANRAIDLPQLGRRLTKDLACPVTTYGFAPDASLRIDSLRASFAGLDLEFTEDGAARRLRSVLVGRHNALNLLAAYGAARALGLDPEPLLERLGRLRGAPGRFETIDAGQPFHVIVDYAHTDDALRNVLEVAKALPHARLLTVFGCGGDRDRTKRPLMGAVAARLSTVVVLTSDNPRSEDPLSIIREIELGTREPQSSAEVRIEPDRRKAIDLAFSLAEPGDVVVVAGKGHEPYQIVNERVLPFDDREVARALLSEKVGR